MASLDSTALIIYQIILAITLFFFFISIILGFVKYGYIRKLRRESSILSFSQLFLDSSTKNAKGEFQDIDARALLNYFQTSNPMHTVFSLACFYAFIPVPTAPSKFDRVHVLWSRAQSIMYFIYSAYLSYLNTILGVDISGASAGSNIVQLNSTSRAFIFFAEIAFSLLLLVVFLSLFRISRSGAMLRIILRHKEAQIAEQSAFEAHLSERLRTTKAMLLSLGTVFVVFSVLNLVNTFAQYTNASVLTVIFLNNTVQANALVVLYTIIGYLSMLAVHIAAEASILDKCLKPLLIAMQNIVDQAQVARDTRHVSLEVNPLFRHKHKHNFRPNEVKLTDVLGGFSLSHCFHSFGSIVDKTRYAGKVLSGPLFALIPGMLFAFAEILLLFLVAPVVTVASLTQLAILLLFGVLPFLSVFWMYTSITISLEDCKVTVLRCLTIYGLILDDPSAEEKPAVAIEAVSNLPDHFSIAGIALTADVFAKIFTLFATLSGVVIALSKGTNG